MCLIAKVALDVLDKGLRASTCASLYLWCIPNACSLLGSLLQRTMILVTSASATTIVVVSVLLSCFVIYVIVNSNAIFIVGIFQHPLTGQILTA